MITNYKRVAQYLRTSSSGQELKLQRGTNEKYLKDYLEDDVLDFVDFDVSATKLSMDERPALSRMLKLIQEDKISTVIVYERDRLARDVYEYIRIITIIHKHNVDVVFTASEAPPFSNDLLLEVWYGLSAQFEGQRIRNRLADARKRNPSSLIGYNKVKATKSSQAKYIAKKDYKENIQQLFASFSEANTKEDIYNIIIDHKSFLKRTEARIIEILRNPFFSGHTITSSGTFETLENVEPMINVDLFKKVQNKIEQFDREISNGIVLAHQQSIIKPYCGICAKELKFNKGVIGKPGHYTCSKHKVSIVLSDLINHTKESLRTSFNRISSSQIKKITVNSTNKQLAELRKYSRQIQTELEDLCIDFVLKYTPQEINSSEEKIGEINNLRDNLNEISNRINLVDERLNDIRFIKEISQIDFSEAIEMEFNTLVGILIAKINVHPEYIQFDYYFSDYLNEGDGENVS